MTVELKVLSVKDSVKGILKLGETEYSVQKDKDALLRALQEPVYVYSPLKAVTEDQTESLFHWLMNHNVDMDSVFVNQLSVHSALLQPAAVASRKKTSPNTVLLTDDEVVFSTLMRNVLLAYYKVYYNQEKANYKEISDAVQVKRTELVQEYNEMCSTNVERIKSGSIYKACKSDELSDAQKHRLRQISKLYYKLDSYLKGGTKSVFWLNPNKRMLLWHGITKLSTCVKGASDCKIDESKYFEVTLFGLFTEARFYSGQTANAYVSDVLGIPKVDCTKGMAELRKQYPNVCEIFKRYYAELHKLENTTGFARYNIALANLINEVIYTVRELDHTVHIVDISQSVTFAFSNRMAVSNVISVLRNTLLNNPEVARVYDAVAVRVDGEKRYVPIQRLMEFDVSIDIYKGGKSRNCAKDFLSYLL